MPIEITAQQIGTAARDFTEGFFYRALLHPYIEAEKKRLIEETDSLINNDAPKNKFSIVAGQRKAITAIEAQIKAWQMRDKLPG